MDDEDRTIYRELYQAYVKFWTSLNKCVDDKYKIQPANGVKPTYTEAKNLWKALKNPRRRKLLWVATGCTHPEFPGDEEAFRREKAEGLINDTNVTTGADAEYESSDDEYDDILDLDAENILPVVNVGVFAPQQNALDRIYNGNRPSGIEDVSFDEEAAPQDPLNANAIAAVNNLGLSLNGSLRTDTPICITQATDAAAAVTDSAPSIMSQIRIEMNSLSLSSVDTVDASLDPVIPTAATTATVAPTLNEIVAESQPNASVETVQGNDAAYYMEEPDISPPRSPVHDDENERTPKRNQVVIHESDNSGDENTAEVGVERVAIESSFLEIASPQSESSSSPIQKRRAARSKFQSAAVTTKGRKRKSNSSKPSTSEKPYTRSRARLETITAQKARNTVTTRGRRNDPDYESDENNLSENDEEYRSPPKRKKAQHLRRVNAEIDAQNDSSSARSGQRRNARSTLRRKPSPIIEREAPLARGYGQLKSNVPHHLLRRVHIPDDFEETAAVNPIVPDSYELIDKDSKRYIANALIIIHERNGKKYFRKYRSCGPGLFNGNLPSNDFYCVECKTLGKDTYVKILKRTNKIYAENDHNVECEMKEYTSEDDD